MQTKDEFPVIIGSQVHGILTLIGTDSSQVQTKYLGSGGGCDISVDFLIVATRHLQLKNAFCLSKGLTRLTGWPCFTGRK